MGQQLREPAAHFAILEQLATGEKELGEIATALRLGSAAVSKYLATLRSLRLVRRQLPFGAAPTARGGLDPGDLYRAEVQPALSDHVEPVFEDACRTHARNRFGQTATRIGRWWGNARHDLRRAGTRSSEEIDIVGVSRKRVTLVGEVQWTGKPLDVTILGDLSEYKVPALEQAGLKTAKDVRTVLYSKSGYTERLRRHADADASLHLIDVSDAMATGT